MTDMLSLLLMIYVLITMKNIYNNQLFLKEFIEKQYMCNNSSKYENSSIIITKMK